MIYAFGPFWEKVDLGLIWSNVPFSLIVTPLRVFTLWSWIQLFFDLLGEPVTNQGLIGYGFDCSQLPNSSDLEGIYLNGHILKLSLSSL